MMTFCLKKKAPHGSDVDGASLLDQYISNQELLGKYKMVLVSGLHEQSLHPDMLERHAQVAAMGSVIVADAYMRPYLSSLGFEPIQHYIQATSDKLIDIIIHWSKPEQEKQLQQIGLNAQKLYLVTSSSIVFITASNLLQLNLLYY